MIYYFDKFSLPRGKSTLTKKKALSPFYIKKEYHIKDVLVLFFSMPIRVFFGKFF